MPAEASAKATEQRRRVPRVPDVDQVLAVDDERLAEADFVTRLILRLLRPLGPGATALARAIEQLMLAFRQGAVKVKKRGRPQYHSHLAQPFG